MNKAKFEELVKKALMLETQSRTAFLANVDDKEVKDKLAFILKDDTESTGFIINTSAGSQSIQLNQFSDLKSGDKVKQFTVIKLIAKGGMGCVYLAYDEKLKRNVAIKTIRSEFLNSQSSKKRFRHEAQILSQINHPSICQIYDYIDYDDGDLLVLELVDGKTLNQLELNDEQKLDVFIQIASALVAAHDKGVIHRDLKPDNIMLTHDGKVKILDFGIAKSKQGNIINQTKHGDTHKESELNEDLTQSGSLMGTLVYMSPEQASTQEITKASDIYSFAIIIQELLTGSSAYRLIDTEDLHQQVINAQLISPDSLPREYQKLKVSMTNINPNKRPTACDVQKQLESIKDIPIIKRRKRKNRLIIIAVLILISLLIFQWYEFRKQQNINEFMTQVRKENNRNKDQIVQIYNLPIHNVTNEIHEIHQSNIKIREKIMAHPSLSQQDTNLLLGESFYIDQDYENASIYLKKAWDLGKNNHEIAHKLGNSHNLLFWQKTSDLTSNQNINDKFSKSLTDSRNNHKENSLYYYSYFSNSSIPKAAMIKAQEYFFNGELQKSLDILDFDNANKKGLSQVYMFKARIYEEFANKLYHQSKFDKGNDHLAQAEKAYLKAIEFSRSYIAPYIMLCRLKANNIRSATYYGQVNPLEYYKQAIEICQQVLLIDPQDVYALDNMAEINYLYAEWKLKNGLDFSEQMLLANKWNNKSLQVEESFSGYNTQAIIYDLYAMQKQESGLNPLEDIEHAIHAYNKTIDMDPSQISLITGNILYSMVVKMQYLLAHGQSMQADIVFVQEILNHEDKSEYKSLDNVDNKYLNLAYVYLLMAYSELQKDQSPLQWIEKSINAYQYIIDKVGEKPYAYGGLAENLLLKAEYEIEKNLDPAGSINTAEQKIDHANKISNTIYWNILTKANIEKIKIKVAINQNTLQENAFIKAHKIYQKSLDISAVYAPTHLHIAQLYEIQLQVEQSKIQKSIIINKGLAALNQCLSVSSEIAEAYILKAKFIEYAQKNNISYNKQDLSIDELNQKGYTINPVLKD